MRTSQEVLTAMKAFTRTERHTQSEWLKNLSEIDQRQLYLEAGYDSLWRYVHEALGYAEGTTSKRLQVMKACRRFPCLYELISESRISLTVISRLSPHLSEALIDKAQGMSVQKVEKLIATLAPKPDVAEKITQHTIQQTMPLAPSPEPPSPEPPSPRPPSPPKATITPLSEKRDLYRFSAGESFARKLQRAKELLPGKTLEALFEQALDDLIQKRAPEKKLATSKPRPASVKKHTRYIPRGIKREALRQNDSCAYLSPHGKRCGSKVKLEFDHILPFALGGSSLDPSQIRVLCQAHNRFLARRTFLGKVPEKQRP